MLISRRFVFNSSTKSSKWLQHLRARGDSKLELGLAVCARRVGVSLPRDWTLGTHVTYMLIKYCFSSCIHVPCTFVVKALPISKDP